MNKILIGLCLLICGQSYAANTIVFDNKMALTWKLNNYGWSNTTTVASNPVLQVVMAAWGDLSLDQLDSSANPITVNPANYGFLDFDINPNSSAIKVSKDLVLNLQVGAGNLPLSQFLTSTMVNSGWTHVHAPISVLDPKGTSFSRIDLLNNSGDSFTVLLDNVTLIAAVAGGGTTGGTTGSTTGSTTGTNTTGGTTTGSTGSTGTTTGSTTGGTTGTATPPLAGRQSWVWVYVDYVDSLAAITANLSSFTHVSPTMYTVNYNYTGGVADFTSCPTTAGTYNCTANGPNSFGGTTAKGFCTQVQALGLKCVPAVYGGAANAGTDQGIQNILNNTNGAGDAFITSMVAEATNNGYDGYNLDWETTVVNGTYADKFVAFVNKFKAALPSTLTLSADVISSNINGTWCSGNSGYMDFPKLNTSSLDYVIIENYTSSLGTASTSCQAAPLSTTTPIGCPLNSNSSDTTFVGMVNFMCSNLSPAKVVIGVESYSRGTNPISTDAMKLLKNYGITKIADWPQGETGYPFVSGTGMEADSLGWYQLLQNFLTIQ